MKRFFILIATIGIGFWFGAGTVSVAQMGESMRVIEQVNGDLYRAQNNRHNTVFLVTGEGIILADPINADFSTWLKAQLVERFPGQEVKYVLQSHHHFDHASGAAVFDDTAEIIAHENFNAEAAKSRATLPGILRRIDKNGNNQVEREEALGGPMAAFFEFADRDRNDIVTAEEMYQDVAEPESTFSGRRTITLGGKTVEMIAPGPNHSVDAAVLYFPSERAVFVVDFITIKKRFAGGFDDGAPLGQWIDAMRKVEAIDFDIAVPGHGDTGTKQDVTAYREYIETLVKAVREGIAAGKDIQQIQQDEVFNRYSGWVNFPDGKDQNVAAAYAAMGGGK